MATTAHDSVDLQLAGLQYLLNNNHHHPRPAVPDEFIYQIPMPAQTKGDERHPYQQNVAQTPSQPPPLDLKALNARLQTLGLQGAGDSPIKLSSSHHDQLGDVLTNQKASPVYHEYPSITELRPQDSVSVMYRQRDPSHRSRRGGTDVDPGEGGEVGEYTPPNAEEYQEADYYPPTQGTTMMSPRSGLDSGERMTMGATTAWTGGTIAGNMYTMRDRLQNAALAAEESHAEDLVQQLESTSRLAAALTKLEIAEEQLRELQATIIAERVARTETERRSEIQTDEVRNYKNELSNAVRALRHARDESKRTEEERRRVTRAFEEARDRLYKYHEELRVRDARAHAREEGRADAWQEAARWMGPSPPIPVDPVHAVPPAVLRQTPMQKFAQLYPQQYVATNDITPPQLGPQHQPQPQFAQQPQPQYAQQPQPAPQPYPDYAQYPTRQVPQQMPQQPGVQAYPPVPPADSRPAVPSPPFIPPGHPAPPIPQSFSPPQPAPPQYTLPTTQIPLDQQIKQQFDPQRTAQRPPAQQMPHPMVPPAPTALMPPTPLPPPVPMAPPTGHDFQPYLTPGQRVPQGLPPAPAPPHQATAPTTPGNMTNPLRQPYSRAPTVAAKTPQRPAAPLQTPQRPASQAIPPPVPTPVPPPRPETVPRPNPADSYLDRFENDPRLQKMLSTRQPSQRSTMPPPTTYEPLLPSLPDRSLEQGDKPLPKPMSQGPGAVPRLGRSHSTLSPGTAARNHRRASLTEGLHPTYRGEAQSDRYPVFNHPHNVRGGHSRQSSFGSVDPANFALPPSSDVSSVNHTPNKSKLGGSVRSRSRMAGALRNDTELEPLHLSQIEEEEERGHDSRVLKGPRTSSRQRMSSMPSYSTLHRPTPVMPTPLGQAMKTRSDFGNGRYPPPGLSAVAARAFSERLAAPDRDTPPNAHPLYVPPQLAPIAVSGSIEDVAGPRHSALGLSGVESPPHRPPTITVQPPSSRSRTPANPPSVRSVNVPKPPPSQPATYGQRTPSLLPQGMAPKAEPHEIPLPRPRSTAPTAYTGDSPQVEVPPPRARRTDDATHSYRAPTISVIDYAIHQPLPASRATTMMDPATPGRGRAATVESEVDEEGAYQINRPTSSTPTTRPILKRKPVPDPRSIPLPASRAPTHRAKASTYAGTVTTIDEVTEEESGREYSRRR